MSDSGNPKVSIVGFYSEPPDVGRHRSVDNDLAIDSEDDSEEPWFIPGVTGRNVVVRDGDNHIIAGFMQVRLYSNFNLDPEL